MKDPIIGVVGLGYVGLPLAIEFGKKYKTVCFDINNLRIEQLKNGIDITNECSHDDLKQLNSLNFTFNIDDLRECNFYIITVPTPVDEFKQPNLEPLKQASRAIGKVISNGDIVVYESTVYPGATEDDCIPEIQNTSGLTYNKDFFAGYSPERINPGDKKNRLATIVKVTSGSNEQIAEYVDNIYSSIITAGTYKASSIKVAEASKIIENVQRDVNIALVNEFHQIFEKMNINTKDVIDAASTKWNFMKLMPGLVGGHCIGVDPYYLLHKSTLNGYIPDLMRTGREINDGMSEYLVSSFLKFLLKNKINPIDLNVLILGFTFKENCPDIRNTKISELYYKLIEQGFNVDVYDPWVNKNEAYSKYNIDVITKVNYLNSKYTASILAVGHEEILDMLKTKEIYVEHIYDFKGLLN